MHVRQKEAVKRYFNGIADEYRYSCDSKQISSLRAYIFSSRKQYVLSMFNLKNVRVLDIGCGPAVLTENLLKNNCEVWGIDISEAMIRQANKKMDEKGFKNNFHFSIGDIENLNFPDAYFDYILCIGVLEYLSDDTQAIRQINRVLKDRGRVIFSVPNLASPFTLMEKVAISLARVFLRVLKFIKIKVKVSNNSLCFKNNISDKYYLPWRFNQQLLKNGLRIDKTIFHIYRLAILNAISPSLSLRVAKKLEVLSRTPFYWMGINYIVRAYKNN